MERRREERRSAQERRIAQENKYQARLYYCTIVLSTIAHNCKNILHYKHLSLSKHTNTTCELLQTP